MPTPTENDPKSKHLFVLIAEHDRKVLLVSFSSIHPGMRYDKTCVVNKGEHKFLRQESYISYRHTRIESFDDMEMNIQSGKAKPLGSIDRQLLDKICAGVEKSKYTGNNALDFYRLATTK
ncbi:MAG: hypothetical protein ACR2NQ_01915 [Thermodesulfobacteriota bacterium]